MMYCVSAVVILASVFQAAGFVSKGVWTNPTRLLASSVLTSTPTSSESPKPADLTPAVDKYVVLGVPSDESQEIAVTAKGPEPKGPDPFKLVKGDVQPISDYIKTLVQSENPVLTMAAQHFFQKRQGKQFRPTIVALMARALSENEDEHMGTKTQKLQIQLGQITEMIHVASLIHDDVLDDAEMRRGGAAVHTMYTNKVAVLAGDYLLARASVLLARLQNFKTVEVMASALDALVQGEIMQARSSKEDLVDMKYYLRKSYFKTASLICSSCKSTALLAGYDEGDLQTISAEKYGYHLGMAYQIVDDILDFTGASAALGKPAQADMELGLATAPILFASESVPELIPLIKRRFKEKGDVQRAVELATNTNGVERAYKLADFHAQQAVDALMNIPSSQARNALLRVLYMALSRDK
jgi:geranyl diphosphate synthase